jgi:hypothetical protein
MPPQWYRTAPCYRCSDYRILPLWKLEYIEMLWNTNCVTLRSVKTSYFNKLLFIKKFRSHGRVGKSLANHKWHGTSAVNMLITASYFRVCGVLYLFKISRKGPSNSKYKHCTYKSTERYYHIWQSMGKISVGMHLQIKRGGKWKNKLHVPEFHNMGMLWRT